MMEFSSIVVVRKLDDKNSKIVNELVEYIRQYCQLKFIPMYEGVERHNVPHNALFISVGGDGTLLHAANLSMYSEDSGVLGLNAGRLGFLTEDIDTLTHNIQNERWNAVLYLLNNIMVDSYVGESQRVVKDPRTALCVRVNGIEEFALNETILSAPLNSFIHTSVEVSGKYVGTFSGNGIAVTTATGSTALGLSAGGAIIGANAGVMQVVPILSHNIAKQPIIVSGVDTITLRAEANPRVERLTVLADSREIFTSSTEVVEMTIQTSEKKVNLIHPHGWNFYDVLTRKMGWK